MWKIDYYSQAVQDEIDAMPIGIRAGYARLAGLLIEFGADYVYHTLVPWAMGYLNCV